MEFNRVPGLGFRVLGSAGLVATGYFECGLETKPLNLVCKRQPTPPLTPQWHPSCNELASHGGDACGITVFLFIHMTYVDRQIFGWMDASAYNPERMNSEVQSSRSVFVLALLLLARRPPTICSLLPCGTCLVAGIVAELDLKGRLHAGSFLKRLALNPDRGESYQSSPPPS